ncbi:MAG: peptidoglycan DD-metalloendopeptidase family protein [Alphaproteobacteria bacterium]|nr:peptidoglycan DD-metalloendopeptidase family protein [Alphaproteobacteria bacterium]
MNLIFGPTFIQKYLPFLLAVMLSACARNDYNPTILDDTKKTIDRNDQSQTRKVVPAGHILIRRGDTLYGIARRHGIPIRKLIEANGLRPPYVIYPGKTLKTPGARIHVARSGETAYGVARRYGVDMGSLVRINKIRPPYRLRSGQRLRLPDPQSSNVARTTSSDRVGTNRPKSTVRPVRGPARFPRQSTTSRQATPKPSWDKSAPKPLKAPPRRSGRKFLWPVKGRIIVAFGPRKGGFHNDGINIAARAGTPIKAAENGVVAYVGNQLQGFGNLVLIKHSGGWMSAYAHGSRVHVRRGSVVKRGETIARVGRTGNVNKPQLHFELRRGDRAVDPRRYLVRFASLRNLREYAFQDARPNPE